MIVNTTVCWLLTSIGEVSLSYTACTAPANDWAPLPPDDEREMGCYEAIKSLVRAPYTEAVINAWYAQILRI